MTSPFIEESIVIKIKELQFFRLVSVRGIG